MLIMAVRKIRPQGTKKINIAEILLIYLAGTGFFLFFLLTLVSATYKHNGLRFPVSLTNYVLVL